MGSKKLIALDLDETTLDGNSRLSPRTLRTLKRVIAAGHCVAVASGRPYSSLPAEVMEIPGIRYAITSNGASVYDSVTGGRVYSLPMPADRVAGLLSMLDGYPDVMIEVYYEGTPYAEDAYIADPTLYGVPAGKTGYIQRTRNPIHGIRAFADSHRDSLDSFDIIVRDEEDKAAWKKRLEAFGGLYITTSASYRLETSNEKGGKGAALKALSAMLEISREDVIAFGNGENDLDMICFAGVGVAVANSHPLLLEAADMIAPANTGDGVAKMLGGLL